MSELIEVELPDGQLIWAHVLVAALAGISGTSTLTVTLSWNGESTKRPG